MNCYHSLIYENDTESVYCVKCNAKFSYEKVTKLANEAIYYNKCYLDLLSKQQND